jgi:hypothetical protein
MRALWGEEKGLGRRMTNMARHYMSEFGSTETDPTEGRSWDINLGPREELLAAYAEAIDPQPSRMARGLGWLRGFGGGDRDVRVAETELTRAPVGTPLPERPAAISFQPPVLESDVDRLKRRLGRVDLDPSSFDPNFDIP